MTRRGEGQIEGDKEEKETTKEHQVVKPEHSQLCSLTLGKSGVTERVAKQVKDLDDRYSGFL